MSTLSQIQEAISTLGPEERKALAIWINSKESSVMKEEDELAILESLDGAIRDLDAGKGVPLDEARKRVEAWTGR